MRRRVAAGAALAFFLRCVAAGAADGDPAAVETARTLFSQMNGRYDALTSLSYTATRSTVSGMKSAEEKWDFRFKTPGLVKIECHTPLHRLVILNESALWEYIPEARKAVHTDLTALPAPKKSEMVASVLSRVAVDGLRLGDPSAMLPRVTSVTQTVDRIYIIQGENPRFILHVDGERKCLVRSMICDAKGDLVMQTEASDFVNVANDFWFPGTVTATYLFKDNIVKKKTAITNVRINDNPSEGFFLFTPPEGVKVLRY